MQSLGKVAGAAAMLATGGALGQSLVVDFDQGVGGPLRNGQSLVGDEVSPYFTMSSSGGNAGLSIFDTSPSGPNVGLGDPDLMVGLGNAVILQNNGRRYRDRNELGDFTRPNDDPNGGTISFDFAGPASLMSLTLIDIDRGNRARVTLTDELGETLVFSVPRGWTNDVDEDGPVGYGVLNLTLLDPQAGEGPGGVATAVASSGFDGTRVVGLEVWLSGSGGIDNLEFGGTVIPAPGVAAALSAGGLLVARRRRS